MTNATVKVYVGMKTEINPGKQNIKIIIDIVNI